VKLNGRQAYREIHFHFYISNAFSSRPILLAEKNLPNFEKPKRPLATEKCHETLNRQFVIRLLFELTDKIYFNILLPFTDIFYFFANDVGGFGLIVQ